MSKKSFTQNILKYTVFFEPAEEGGFIAKVPNLPGCATQGESFEEAKNTKRRRQLYHHSGDNPQLLWRRLNQRR